VSQLKVELVLQSWAIDQPTPGVKIQKRNWGVAQPVALADQVTLVPTGCGELGLAERLTPVHGGLALFSVYTTSVLWACISPEVPDRAQASAK
jgi:hypothetical protein